MLPPEPPPPLALIAAPPAAEILPSTCSTPVTVRRMAPPPAPPTPELSLRKLYQDESLPKELRRRILEGAVRAPEPWHQDAIRTAYQSGDSDWMVTAVFAMRYVRGFDDQILESLKSADEDIHYEAVVAAGNWSLDAAWPHV